MTRHHLLQRTSLCAAACALALACTPDSAGDDTGTGAAEDTPLDDLPASVPPPPEGARVVELAEQIVPPGSDVMICHFLEPEQADIYASALDTYQGKFGHHLVLFRTIAPEPPGTIRDCTSVADMVNLLPVIAPVRFGLDGFPENAALRVPAGTQMVVQQHYVNTGDRPIRVRDVLQLQTKPKDEIDTLIGFYGISEVDFQLQPDDTIEQEITFSCAAPRDMNILLLGPHMHEWGLRTSTEIVRNSGDVESILRVDPWQAHYRDEPPVQTWTLDAPLVLRQGDQIRTSCIYQNTADRVLEFPVEMCATYGYYFPAPEGSEVWTCDGA